MSQDNEDGDLREEEVINFARFFVSELRSVNIKTAARVFYKLIQDEEPNALEFLAEYQRHPW